MPRPRGLALLPLLITCVLALVPEGAGASAAWTAPAAIGGTYQGAGTLPHVALGPDGTLAAIWTESIGAKQLLRVQVKPPGAPLGAPETVSPAGVDASQAQVGVDASGEVIVSWIAYDASDSNRLRAYVAIRPPGGPFGAPAAASPPANDIIYPSVTPELAVAPSGDAVLAWGDSVTQRAWYATRAAGGSFGTAVKLPSESGGGVGSVAVGAARNGAAIVGWMDATSSASGIGTVVRPSAAAPFGSPSQVSVDPAEFAGAVGVAVDPSGDAAAAFDSVDRATLSKQHMNAAVQPAGGSWTTPDVLSTTSTNGWKYPPNVTLDDLGTASVEWFDGVPNPRSLRVASRPRGGGFVPAVALAQNIGATWDLTAHPGGGALATWDDLATGNLSLATLPAAGGFGTPVWSSPAVALLAGNISTDLRGWADDAGDTVLSFFGGDQQMHYLALDGTGPHLDALQIPTAPVAGTPAVFSVAPRDDWSALGITTWSWGDGTSDSAGPSVTHAFPAPGDYTVTVTARDTLGNQTTATRQVTVAAPPPDRTAPVITGLRLTQTVFRPGPRATAIDAATHRPRRPAGTSLRFTLSEPAGVTITIQRRGRRRWVAAGTLHRRGLAAGALSVAFSGRVGKRALKPGAYRLTVRATDAAGNVSAPHTVAFTISR
jgi:hypothetical protein